MKTQNQTNYYWWIIFCLWALLYSPFTSFSQPIFDPTQVQTIDITFTGNDWDTKLDSLKEKGKDRLIATVEINGEVFDSVGVRYKGNSTYAANRIKNPFNIKLDHIRSDQSYQGASTLKLANGFADPSFVREVVAYEILAKYMPAPRAAYLRVNINGAYHGLYVNTETIDKSFVDRWFGSRKHTFFKGAPQFDQSPPGFCTPGNYASLEYLGPDSACYEVYYELKSDQGWKDLIDLTEQLASEPDSIEAMLDIDQALWMLAFNHLLINLDSYSGKFCHNYYLYQDEYDVFHPIVWDLNMAFGGFNHTGVGGLLKLAEMKVLEPLIHQNDPQWPLIQTVFSNPDWQKRYIAHLKTMLYENITNEWYLERAEELQMLITPHVLADSNALFPDSDFLTNIYEPSYHSGFRTGIRPLMKDRNDFLVNHPLIQPQGPKIRYPQYMPLFPAPDDSVLLTVEVENAEKVWLGMRNDAFAPFKEILLYDDGFHGDGVANDQLWGGRIKVDSTNLDYYIYAEGAEAGRFFPPRAQYEFLTIKVIDTASLPAIVINEFMADNDATVSDENGDFDDWVELYNRTEADISLSGYFLTDDFDEPTQWSFPDTMIKADSYLMVWLDDDETGVGLHANFRLNKDGEELMLFSANAAESDSIEFPIQTTDLSWGRFPNGSGNFSEMTPTFSLKNDFHTSNEPEFNLGVSLYPNPAKAQLFLAFEQHVSGELVLFDMVGRELLKREIVQQKELMINLVDYTSGLYWIKWNGKMIGKFVKE